MKIPRYEAGRTNIQSLEGIRSAQQTPEEAARFAGMKEGMIGDVLETTGKAVMTYGTVRLQTKLAEDNLELESMEQETKLNLMTGWNDIIESGGSADDAEKMVQNVLSQRQNVLGKLTHPRSRDRVSESLRLSTELMREEQRGKVMEYGTDLATNKFNGQLENAENDRDVGRLMLLSAIGKESKLINEEGEAKIAAMADKIMFEDDVSAFAKQAFNEIDADPDAETAQYAKAHDIQDDAMREATVKALDAVVIDVNKKHGREMEVENLQLDTKVDNIIAAMFVPDENGETLTMTIPLAQAMRDSGDLGTDSKMTARYRRLASSIYQAQGSHSDYLDFINTDPREVRGTATNQKMLDQQMSIWESEVSNQGGEFDHVTGTVLQAQTYGFVNYKANTYMSKMSSNVDSFMNGFQYYDALTSDRANLPDIDIDEENKDLAEMARNVMNLEGTDRRAAVEGVFDSYRSTEKHVIDARKKNFEDNFSEESVHDFEDYMESGEFDQDGWFDTEGDSQWNDRAIIQAGVVWDRTVNRMMMSGSGYEEAKARASRAIQESFVQTNINGDWEVQRYGIGGDIEKISERIMLDVTSGEHTGGHIERYRIGVDGVYEEVSPENVDTDKISFVPFDSKHLATDNEGNVHYQVLYDNRPMYDENMKTVTRTVNKEKAGSYEGATQTIQEFTDLHTKLSKQIAASEKANALPASDSKVTMANRKKQAKQAATNRIRVKHLQKLVASEMKRKSEIGDF